MSIFVGNCGSRIRALIKLNNDSGAKIIVQLPAATYQVIFVYTDNANCRNCTLQHINCSTQGITYVDTI